MVKIFINPVWRHSHDRKNHQMISISEKAEVKTYRLSFICRSDTFIININNTLIIVNTYIYVYDIVLSLAKASALSPQPCYEVISSLRLRKTIKTLLDMSAGAKSIGSPPRFWLTEVKGCVVVD